MSLNAILETIRASGAAQVREIEQRAYAQAREVLVNAQLEAEQIKERTRAAAVAPAFKERARLLHRARLEALQITGNVREALVDGALEQTRGHLAGMRTDTAYPAVLRRFLQEALAELAVSIGDGLVGDRSTTTRLEADPRDRALLNDILHDLGMNLPVSYTLNCWGGLIARSQDGRIVAINTLEARLERATPSLRRYLAALFENDLPEIEMAQILERVFLK